MATVHLRNAIQGRAYDEDRSLGLVERTRLRADHDVAVLLTAGRAESVATGLISGIPRMARPRLCNDRYAGFAVVDPGGNWIRINEPAHEPEARTKLAKAVKNAVRPADAKGDEQQALRIVEGALKRTDGSEPELRDAQAYRDELAERIAGSGPRSALECAADHLGVADRPERRE